MTKAAVTKAALTEWPGHQDLSDAGGTGQVPRDAGAEMPQQLTVVCPKCKDKPEENPGIKGDSSHGSL